MSHNVLKMLHEVVAVVLVLVVVVVVARVRVQIKVRFFSKKYCSSCVSTQRHLNIWLDSPSRVSTALFIFVA